VKSARFVGDYVIDGPFQGGVRFAGKQPNMSEYFAKCEPSALEGDGIMRR
jgi:hypothetical protein